MSERCADFKYLLTNVFTIMGGDIDWKPSQVACEADGFFGVDGSDRAGGMGAAG
jgi:hypothetical protein